VDNENAAEYLRTKVGKTNEAIKWATEKFMLIVSGVVFLTFDLTSSSRSRFNLK
jgi:hypothetical protein